MKVDWGKVGLAAGAVGLFAALAKAAKPAPPIKGLGETDVRAAVVGGATLVLGVGAVYALFFHDWDKEEKGNLSGLSSKAQKKYDDIMQLFKWGMLQDPKHKNFVIHYPSGKREAERIALEAAKKIENGK